MGRNGLLTALRDAALDLEPGTSEFEKSTALGLDADVADCTDSVSHDGPTGAVDNENETPTTGAGLVRVALLTLAAGFFAMSAARRRWITS